MSSALGFSPEELVGRVFTEFVRPQDILVVKRQLHFPPQSNRRDVFLPGFKRTFFCHFRRKERAGGGSGGGGGGGGRDGGGGGSGDGGGGCGGEGGISDNMELEDERGGDDADKNGQIDCKETRMKTDSSFDRYVNGKYFSLLAGTT